MERRWRRTLMREIVRRSVAVVLQCEGDNEMKLGFIISVDWIFIGLDKNYGLHKPNNINDHF